MACTLYFFRPSVNTLTDRQKILTLVVFRYRRLVMESGERWSKQNAVGPYLYICVLEYLFICTVYLYCILNFPSALQLQTRVSSRPGVFIYPGGAAGVATPSFQAGEVAGWNGRARQRGPLGGQRESENQAHMHRKTRRRRRVRAADGRQCTHAASCSER